MAIGPGAGGSRMLGRYELIQELAKSQIGPLWVARAPVGDELVAIRRVSTAAPVTAAEKDSLSEGAWWTLEVQHSTIAHGKDVVMSENELGIVTEYVEGEVLRSLLRLSSFKRKPIPLPAALRIALDVLDALHEAEAQAQPLTGGKSSYMCGGLVPDSVLVGSDGKTRLLDIGIVGPCSTVATIARHPEMAAYASPEQTDEALLDVRSNLYAIGVMLWEMLAGKRLYVGSTYAAVIERIKAGDPPRLDASKPVGGEPIPAAVADVVARAIQSDAAERFQTPKAMSDALASAATAATAEEVAALVDDLAGNTLATRRKVVERAIKGEPPAKLITAPTPATKSSPTAATKSSPTAATKSSPTAAGSAQSRERKKTLLGIAPPGGIGESRDELDSIDSSELESISKVELLPVEAPVGASSLVKALLTEPEEAPKPPAAGRQSASDADDDAETRVMGTPETALRGSKPALKLPEKYLKTKVLGTPAAATPDAKREEPAKPGTPPAAEADQEEEVPVSLEPESIREDEEDKKPAAADGEERASDESAVAWLGPPPGVALDEPESERAKARKKRTVKYVGIACAGALAVLLVGLAFGGNKDTDQKMASSAPPEPKTAQPQEPKQAANTAPTTEAQKSTASEETPSQPAQSEQPSETDKKPVRSTTAWRPRSTTKRTTTTAKSTTTTAKPKTKKSTFTPSGI